VGLSGQRLPPCGEPAARAADRGVELGGALSGWSRSAHRRDRWEKVAGPESNTGGWLDRVGRLSGRVDLIRAEIEGGVNRSCSTVPVDVVGTVRIVTDPGDAKSDSGSIAGRRPFGGAVDQPFAFISAPDAVVCVL
jgi:hypothetical protein